MTTITTQIAVIGAGPAGIVTALELADRGFEVCLVESGRTQPDAQIQALGDAAELDPQRHAPMNLATCRALGGASQIWGGRVVPYDPIDFVIRPYIPYGAWPFDYTEVEKHHARACDYFCCGQPVFSTLDLPEIKQKSIVPGLPDEEVKSTDLERWSLPTNFGREYGARLKSHPRIRLLSGYTAVKLVTSANDAHVERVELRSLSDSPLQLNAKKVILACGALESTRLLMCSGQSAAGLGNASGLLGRLYMGHISGRIARVRFTTPAAQTQYGFHRDREGVYLRSRFTLSAEAQQRERLTNVALWLVNPPVGDATHRNGVLSFVYLALRSPLGKRVASAAIRQSTLKSAGGSTLLQHAMNIVRYAPSTAAFIASFGVRRFLLRRKAPGFFQKSAANCYDLHYHGEQIPNPESRVTLSDQRDALGMPRLNIDLRFMPQDVEGVLRTHELLDQHLRKHQVGQLKYLADDCAAAVWDQAADGYHQVGTTRMSEFAPDGVVDPNCRVHGVDNLYVASSSTFPTSGQANSTFLIVALALRLADHLAAERDLPARPIAVRQEVVT